MPPRSKEAGPPQADSVLVPRRKNTSAPLSAKSSYAADRDSRRKKIADVDGRTIYGDPRGWRPREKTPLDALADFFLAPFPPELRGKIRKTVANATRAIDDLLLRLGSGGGGPKAIRAAPKDD